MRPTGYTHSEVFARLKNIREEVKQTFTSHQWLSVLDHFIESALDPIATAYPALADVYFAKVVAWQTHRPSVKFSRNPKSVLPTMLFNALTTRDEVKRKHQREMMLNRGLLFGLISLFAKATDDYMRLHDPAVPMSRGKRLSLLATAADRCGSPYLYAAVRQSQFYARKAYWFKELIVQKYTRLALVSAKRTYEDTDCQANLNDVIQIYLMYLSKAIDRCDSRQGVLTTFIQTWFYSAKAEIMKMVVHESKTSSYDELLESGMSSHSVEPDRKYEVLQHLCVTAKQLDPSGAIRYSLGIPEIVTSAEKHVLRSHVTAGIEFNPINPKESSWTWMM